MHDFLEALRFLTVLPLPRTSSRKKGSVARSMFYFPLVGFLIGIVSLWFFVWFRKFFPERIANFILLITPLVLSGGLHLGGFAGFCDGFFSGKTKEETLRIMKDSQIRVWAAAGVTLLLLAKFELLQELPLKSMTFLMAMTASRWSQVVLSYFLPVARPSGGLGEEGAQKIGLRELIGASAFLFFVTLSLAWVGFFAFLGLLIFLWLLALLFKKRVGGVTGDLIGATSETTELFILLFVTALHQIWPGL